MKADLLLTNAMLATMAGDTPYGLIENGAIAVTDGTISWVGSAADVPPQATTIKDCHGQLITPALIDCHTHLVHGGNRAKEFELRLQGASYEEIARNGGGIISTVTDTRSASEQQLTDSALKRLDALIAEGVGTVEIKSGYGLDIENEMKMLRVARGLDKQRNIRVRTTFLGAHALPPEFDNADDYVTFICDEMLPAAHAEGLVDAVDGFCENIGFSVSQMERVFDKSTELGLPIKLHAEQLSDQQGSVMAAKRGALSVDHLEYLKPEDAKVLAQHNTVAVLLPAAFYYLRETKLPPIDALRKAGVAMAVATDNNPGTSPVTSLLLSMNMACTLFRLTPEEALRGATANAAKALGLQNELGAIELGKQADFNVWDVSHPAELSYNIGFNPLSTRIIAGKI